MTKVDKSRIESYRYIIQQKENKNPNYFNEVDGFYTEQQKEDIKEILERTKKIEQTPGNNLAEKYRNLYENRVLLAIGDGKVPILKSWSIGGWESTNQQIEIYVFEDKSGYYYYRPTSKTLTIFENVNEIHEKIFDVVRNEIIFEEK